MCKLKEEFFDYYWEDLGDAFISPGIIDLNVNFSHGMQIEGEDTIEYDHTGTSEHSSAQTSSLQDQWEGYEFGSKAAVSGGVTTVVEHSGPALIHPKEFQLKLQAIQDSLIHCDIGFVVNLAPSNLEDVKEFSSLGVLGFKASLLPSNEGTFDCKNLSKLFTEVASVYKTLFVHPEKTNERYLYMSSPFRNETFEVRQYKPEPYISIFAGAFPEDLEPSSSDLTPEHSPQKGTPNSTKETDLEKSIKQNLENLGPLVKVEMNSYSSSGFTLFRPPSPLSKRIPSIQSPQKPVKLETKQKLGQFPLHSPVKPTIARPSGLRRPPPIVCDKPPLPKENIDYKQFLANSPPHWESNGVQLLINELSKSPICKVHVSNVSSANAIYLVRRARRDNPGLPISCETAGFYLNFYDELIKDGDTRFKANPPIRDSKNQELLIEVLKLGGIDCLTSYHRPIKPSLKSLVKGDFKRAVSGISSLGFTLQCALKAFDEQAQKVAPKLAKVLSERPAEIVGLAHKGSIQVGKLADLVVWEAGTLNKVENAYTRHPQVCPFVGEMLPGKVLKTYLRGKLVYSGGEFYARGTTI